MTKMLIDRSTVEQALEALEAMTKHFGFARLGSSSLADTMKRGDAHVAMNNLRAALAEPVQEPQGCDHCNHPLYAAVKCRVCGRVTEPVQEPKPVAIVGTQADTWKGYEGQWLPPGPPIKTVHMLRELPEGTLLYTVPPQPPAEPVAYSVGRTLHWHEGKGVNDAQLFAAPPQRKPLTEEEIEKAYREIWRDLPSDFDHTSSGWIEQGIRYAERAHNIKE